MNLVEYLALREKVSALAPETVDRDRSAEPPKDPVELALRAAFVILSASLRYSIVQRVWPALRQNLVEHGEVGDTFKHAAKTRAINSVFADRNLLFAAYESARSEGDEAVLVFCEGLPSVGPVTRYHLAKNLGVDCAKPDIWLSRVANAAGEDVQTLCRRLAGGSGDTIAIVDSVIWRACEQGLWIRSEIASADDAATA